MKSANSIAQEKLRLKSCNTEYEIEKWIEAMQAEYNKHKKVRDSLAFPDNSKAKKANITKKTLEIMRLWDEKCTMLLNLISKGKKRLQNFRYEKYAKYANETERAILKIYDIASEIGCYKLDIHNSVKTNLSESLNNMIKSLKENITNNNIEAVIKHNNACENKNKTITWMSKEQKFEIESSEIEKVKSYRPKKSIVKRPINKSNDSSSYKLIHNTSYDKENNESDIKKIYNKISEPKYRTLEWNNLVCDTYDDSKVDLTSSITSNHLLKSYDKLKKPKLSDLNLPMFKQSYDISSRKQYSKRNDTTKESSQSDKSIYSKVENIFQDFMDSKEINSVDLQASIPLRKHNSNNGRLNKKNSLRSSITKRQIQKKAKTYIN